MTSSESDDQPTSRKRSRTSASSEDASAAGKKARGRPRVDTQDETAADVSELSFFRRSPIAVFEKREGYFCDGVVARSKANAYTPSAFCHGPGVSSQVHQNIIGYC